LVLWPTLMRVRLPQQSVFFITLVRSIKLVKPMNVRGKDKRVGRYSGKTARTRKAIVTLTEDSNDIKIFKDDNDNKEENK